MSSQQPAKKVATGQGCLWAGLSLPLRCLDWPASQLPDTLSDCFAPVASDLETTDGQKISTTTNMSAHILSQKHYIIQGLAYSHSILALPASPAY